MEKGIGETDENEKEKMKCAATGTSDNMQCYAVQCILGTRYTFCPSPSLSVSLCLSVCLCVYYLFSVRLRHSYLI